MSSTVTVYAKESCSDCAITKRVLTENRVVFSLVDVEKVEGAIEEMKGLNGGLNRVPTIVLPSGRVVIEPTAPVLAAILAKEGLLAPAAG